MQTLRTLQQSAADTLRRGLEGVQTARAELSQALADRKDLPRRFTEDPVKTAILISSTETLEGFASGLYDITNDEASGSLPAARAVFSGSQRARRQSRRGVLGLAAARRVAPRARTEAHGLAQERRQPVRGPEDVDTYAAGGPVFGVLS